MNKLTFLFIGLILFMMSGCTYYDTVVDNIPLESNGAIPVNIQDQHSHIVGILMSQGVGPPQTLAYNTTVDNYTVEMATGHTFTTGDEFFMVEQDKSFHARVMGVSVNTLTLNSPMDQVYTTSALVFEVISNMAVDGSITPQEFSVQVGSGANISLDITGIRYTITDNVVMDDGKFGGISALPRGIVLRVEHEDGTHNLFTAKTNGKMGLIMNHQVYTDKAPAGEYGVQFTHEIRNDLGVTIRLDPGDKVFLIIQDDLIDLTTFKAWVYGHQVTD